MGLPTGPGMGTADDQTPDFAPSDIDLSQELAGFGTTEQTVAAKIVVETLMQSNRWGTFNAATIKTPMSPGMQPLLYRGLQELERDGYIVVDRSGSVTITPQPAFLERLKAGYLKSKE